MIPLFVDSLLTVTPRCVREMGYLREAVGIRRRWKHCSTHWAEHVRYCRAIILKAAERCYDKRRVVILGGGLMHDIPLDELCAMFGEVVLADIVHPVSSRLLTRRYKNLKRMTLDVTGVMERVFQIGWERDKPLPLSRPGFLLDGDAPDLTVSLNLASQLPCMPIAWLKKWKARNDGELDRFARQVIDAHMQWLKEIPGVVCLVTDTSKLKYDLLGRLAEETPILYGSPLPLPDDNWIWKLAPAPEVDAKFSYYRRVSGYINWKPHRLLPGV